MCRPAELGLNLVWTELNLQFFVDVLSDKKECGEVLTSVCYAGNMQEALVKWGMPIWLLFPSLLLPDIDDIGISEQGFALSTVYAGYMAPVNGYSTCTKVTL